MLKRKYIGMETSKSQLHGTRLPDYQTTVKHHGAWKWTREWNQAGMVIIMTRYTYIDVDGRWRPTKSLSPSLMRMQVGMYVRR